MTDFMHMHACSDAHVSHAQAIQSKIKLNYVQILRAPDITVCPMLEERRNKLYKRMFCDRRKTGKKTGGLAAAGSDAPALIDAALLDDYDDDDEDGGRGDEIGGVLGGGCGFDGLFEDWAADAEPDNLWKASALVSHGNLSGRLRCCAGRA